MAPVDRAEHRQQRLRGAGNVEVKHTAFSFSLGALGRPNKQASLPPQRSSRRTPVRSTSAGPPGSAQRQRSASAQRSGSRKRSITPRRNFVTPKLGKRKRASRDAVPAATEADEDELSPKNDAENAPSIEKVRKAAPPVSPIREEEDDLVDELSIVGDIPDSTRKPGSASRSGHKTPTPAAERTPSVTARSSEGPGTQLAGSARKSPVTPAIVSNRKRKSSGVPHVEEDPEESPDELTPKPSTAGAARSKTKSPSVPTAPEDVDELSPEQGKDIRPSPVPGAVSKAKSQQIRAAHASTPEVQRRPGRSPAVEGEDEPDIMESTPAQSEPRRVSNNSVVAETPPETSSSNKARRSKRTSDIVPEEENTTPSAAPRELALAVPTHTPDVPRRGRRPRRVVAEEEEDAETSANPPRDATRNVEDSTQEERGHDEADELSPDKAQTGPKARSMQKDRGELPIPRRSKKITIQRTNTLPNESARHASSIREQSSAAEDPIEKPPKKRQKRGPTQAIQVMRLEGTGTRELTVVDTTRHVLEQWTTHRIAKMTNKLGQVADAARARKLRQNRNVVLAYKEEIDDVLLGLQDANDTGNHRATRYKRMCKENRQLRNDILELENERLKVALENDEHTENFLREKQELEEREKLSTALYDIQAAIRNGKEKALREGREDEGPELSLKTLLDDAASNFGPHGLLARVRNFNAFLGKAAGIFEGKA